MHMGVRIGLACIGVGLLVIGAALRARQADDVDHSDRLASSAAPAAVSERAPTGITQALTFDPPVIICRFIVKENESEGASALEQLWAQLAARIDSLSHREITFYPLDSHDGVGSIRFNDEGGRRWIVQTRLTVERVDLDGNATVALCFAIANPITEFEKGVGPISPSEFLAEWGEAQATIELPITDASAEFEEIVTVQLK